MPVVVVTVLPWSLLTVLELTVPVTSPPMVVPPAPAAQLAHWGWPVPEAPDTRHKPAVVVVAELAKPVPVLYRRVPAAPALARPVPPLATLRVLVK